MDLKKVSTIDYDKKDSHLITCPHCNTSSFSIFTIIHKIDEQEHIHIRCIFCDLTYCPEIPNKEQVHIQVRE